MKDIDDIDLSVAVRVPFRNVRFVRSDGRRVGSREAVEIGRWRTGGGSGGSTLPVTGTAVGGSLLVALLLIGAGAALVVVRRRRIKFEA